MQRTDNQLLLSLQDVVTHTHPTQGDTLGYKLLGFQPVNLLCLHRSITDIHGRCPCYSVPFRCYNNICLLFLHQSFTDIHGCCPCYSVDIRCNLYRLPCNSLHWFDSLLKQKEKGVHQNDDASPYHVVRAFAPCL